MNALLQQPDDPDGGTPFAMPLAAHLPVHAFALVPLRACLRVVDAPHAAVVPMAATRPAARA